MQKKNRHNFYLVLGLLSAAGYGVAGHLNKLPESVNYIPDGLRQQEETRKSLQGTPQWLTICKAPMTRDGKTKKGPMGAIKRDCMDAVKAIGFKMDWTNAQGEKVNGWSGCQPIGKGDTAIWKVWDRDGDGRAEKGEVQKCVK